MVGKNIPPPAVRGWRGGPAAAGLKYGTCKDDVAGAELDQSKQNDVE